MNSSTTPPVPLTLFSAYQKRVVGLLAFLQFAVILDFMLMSPLGALIIPSMSISTQQFGWAVSAYAFSAGLSGLLTAGFADRFDRKKILMFFYTGFIIGTFWCGMVDNFTSLLMARIVTGLFGGVIGSVVMAIAADLYAPQLRGRVIGLIQTAFGASQVLGIPFGLYLSNRWDWHVPFFAMAGLGLVGGVIVALTMKPVTAHLSIPQEHSPWMHLYHTVTEPRYLLAFAAVSLLSTGGFMLMPFSSAFIVNNLGVSFHDLPTLYLVTGIASFMFGPLIGKASDKYGKFEVFTVGCLTSIVMVLIYTHLHTIPLVGLIVVNVLLFTGIFARMIPFQAMMSTVPTPVQRGSFSSISSSIQQLSGGLASAIAGQVVSFGADGKLQHFDILGYIIVATSLTTFVLLWAMKRSHAIEAVAKVMAPS